MSRLSALQHGNEEVWCAKCQKSVRTVAVDEAALLLRVSSRAIFRWVDEGIVHSVETSQGLLQICLNSLIWVSTQTHLTRLI